MSNRRADLQDKAPISGLRVHEAMNILAGRGQADIAVSTGAAGTYRQIMKQGKLFVSAVTQVPPCEGSVGELGLGPGGVALIDGNLCRIEYSIFCVTRIPGMRRYGGVCGCLRGKAFRQTLVRLAGRGSHSDQAIRGREHCLGVKAL